MKFLECEIVSINYPGIEAVLPQGDYIGRKICITDTHVRQDKMYGIVIKEFDYHYLCQMNGYKECILKVDIKGCLV